MIHSITFKKQFRCFEANDVISFRSGVNLLVGDQGCGKSTIIQLIVSSSKKPKSEIVSIKTDKSSFRAFDFEVDMPRNRSYFENDVMLQLALKWSSHGEAVNSVLRALPIEGDMVILLDEPDMALSVRSCSAMCKQFKELVEHKCQVIAAVHNPTLILDQDEVLSLEHRQWMESKKFLTTHGWKHESTCAEL